MFADGTSLETDLVVFSAGIRPRDELARAAGLAVGERGGIRIDAHCQTTDPDIYAIGECALWEGRIFGLVAPGYQMAEVAARHLAGETQRAVPRRRHEHQAQADGRGRRARSATRTAARPARSTTSTPTSAGVYKKLVVAGDRKQLLGAILVGDASDYGTLLQMALNAHAAARAPRGPDPAGARRRASKGLGVDLLPDSALICSCNSVTKGAICAAIADGCDDPGRAEEEDQGGDQLRRLRRRSPSRSSTPR